VAPGLQGHGIVFPFGRKSTACELELARTVLRVELFVEQIVGVADLLVVFPFGRERIVGTCIQLIVAYVFGVVLAAGPTQTVKLLSLLLVSVENLQHVFRPHSAGRTRIVIVVVGASLLEPHLRAMGLSILRVIGIGVGVAN